MKKEYIIPTLKVIRMNAGQQLLAGSGKATDNTQSFGGEANENDEAGARNLFFWDLE